MRHNLMELLHEGDAVGMDTEWGRRQKWSDANYGGGILTKESTQEFAKLSGYLDCGHTNSEAFGAQPSGYQFPWRNGIQRGIGPFLPL